MLFSSIIPLIALNFLSCALAHVKVNSVTPETTATAIAERVYFSTIGTSTPCSTVSGLASPQPSEAFCGLAAKSDGSPSLIIYTSGTYTESIAACGEICLETSGCANLYFIEGKYCSLHYGLATVEANSNGPFSFYDASCFSCSALTTSSSSTTSTTLSSKVSSSLTETSPTADTTSSIATSTQTSSSTPTSPWTSIQTDPASYDMAITTTYTQPAQCTGGSVTQMAYHGTNLWENAINPVATSTITTCYPSQFYSSIMGGLSSVELPAFSALICPYNWETINYNETYIICCPNNFNVYAPNYHANTDRPFAGAACTSIVGADVLLDITSYDSTAYLTVVYTSAPDYGTFIYANAFDGIIATANAIATASSSTPATTTPSTSVSTSHTPAATVSVSGGSGARNFFDHWHQFCVILLHLLVPVVFA